MKTTGIGKSHAKIILMGEHSVVYGEPAIALPLPSVATTVTIHKNNGSQKEIASRYFSGHLMNMPEEMAGVLELLRQLIQHFNGENDGWKMTIKSDIPAERGMGSSAATAVAIIRAFFDFYDTSLERPELLRWADIEEKITHRSPSGLDAATVSSDKPLWFIKGHKGEKININLSATMVVADTGIKGATKEAINEVKSELKNDHDKTAGLIQHLGQLVKASRQYIANNESAKLGISLTSAHRDLQKLGVSSNQLDKLVNAAIDGGAYGAKLTGGGRGGCMFALTSNALAARKLASVLKDTGASETWIQPLGKED